jgi:hypothetical protein
MSKDDSNVSHVGLLKPHFIKAYRVVDITLYTFR